MNEEYLSEPKVQEWMAQAKGSGCKLSTLTPLHLVHKRNGELLFGFFRAELYDPEGNRMPDIVVIRGHACVIVPLIKNRDTGEKRYLMVRQWRTGSGMLSLEFPAGMVDRESDPAVVAVRELEEETGLTISKEELHPLCDKLLYSSSGLQDEGIYYFGCIVELDNKDFISLENRITGAMHEEEHITVTLKTREEGERETNSTQVRLAFCLFSDFLRKRSKTIRV